MLANTMKLRVPEPLYTRHIVPLRPGDFTAIIPVRHILDQFRMEIHALPDFVVIVPEDVLVLVINNIAFNSGAHVEMLFQTFYAKIVDDFTAVAYPEDPVVFQVAMGAFGNMVTSVMHMFTAMGLFSDRGLNFFRVAFINANEVVCYDVRTRGDATIPTQMVGVNTG